MSLGTACVKTEVEDALAEVHPEEETEALCVKEEADNEDLCKLYEDHQVKDELVLGPVLIHRPHVGSIQAPVNGASAASPLGRACSVRLERLLLGAERGAGRVRRHTNNTRGALCEKDREGVWVKETIGVASCTLNDKLVPSPALTQQHHVSSVRVAAGSWGRACSVRLQRVLPGAGRLPCHTPDTSEPQQHGSTDTSGTGASYELSGSCAGELAQPRGLACSVRPERLVRRLPRRTDKSRDVSASEHAPTQATYECHHCGKHLHNKSLLIKHIRTHSLGPSCNSKPEEFSFDGQQIIRKRKHRATHTGNKPFKCRYCDYRGRRKGTIKEHERIHTGDKPFKCNQCNYKCRSNFALQRHQSIHTCEKPFKCRYCDYRGRRKDTIKEHERIHTGDKPFKCNQCNYKCRSNFALRSHQTIHTGERPFKCRYCDYRSRVKQSLKIHERTHTGDMPFKCNHCDYKCNIKSSLRTHLRLHTGEKPFKCRYCDYRCRQIQHLRTHERIHTKETPFKCNHCEFKTKQKTHLRTHLRIHTGEKPFRCNHCNFRSRHKHNLRSHEMTHTGEKPFKCNHCDYKCNQSSALQSHLRIHTGEKPFKCGYCDYRCRHSSQLRTHEMMHTGVKPFSCSSCDYKCRQKPHLRNHMKLHF